MVTVMTLHLRLHIGTLQAASHAVHSACMCVIDARAKCAALAGHAMRDSLVKQDTCRASTWWTVMLQAKRPRLEAVTRWVAAAAALPAHAVEISQVRHTTAG